MLSRTLPPRINSAARSVRVAVTIGALLGIGGAAALLAWPREATARLGEVAAAAQRTLEERRVLDADIALYESAARLDPLSATFPARAASLYLRRARSTASDDDLRRAESRARRSLAVRTSRNDDAAVTLIGALLAQHRFQDAHDVVKQLVASRTDAPEYRAILGEVQLELGHYQSARATFLSLDSVRARPAIAIRYARFLELTGRTAEARALMRAVGARMLSRHDLPRSDMAWLFVRLGDLEMREGRARGARRAYRAGLESAPGDHRLLLALARLDAAQGRLDEARARAEEALTAAFDPAVLTLLGEIASAEGDTARLAEYHRALELMVTGGSAPPHRAWSLALLDDGRSVDAVLARAERDLLARRDVFGHDLVAWALYKRGEHRRAARAMDSALAQGTQDALMHYHAGMILIANADSTRGAHHLRRALALNGYFGVTQPARARAVLDTLDARLGRR